MEKRLINKRVKIFLKNTGVAEYATYKGTVITIHQDSHNTFIELDTGEFINMRYVASISIQD